MNKKILLAVANVLLATSFVSQAAVTSQQQTLTVEADIPQTLKVSFPGNVDSLSYALHSYYDDNIAQSETIKLCVYSNNTDAGLYTVQASGQNDTDGNYSLKSGSDKMDYRVIWGDTITTKELDPSVKVTEARKAGTPNINTYNCADSSASNAFINVVPDSKQAGSSSVAGTYTDTLTITVSSV
jgi:spore coat protein U-like protein